MKLPEGVKKFFHTVFISEEGLRISTTLWVVLIFVLSAKDNNIYPISMILVWVVLALAFIVGLGGYYWLMEKIRKEPNSYGNSNGDKLEYNWIVWLLFPGSVLIFMTVALFTMGGFGKTSYYTYTNPLGTRIESGKNISLHVPVWDSVQEWPDTSVIQVALSATTKDGKAIKADLKVHVSLDADNTYAAKVVVNGLKHLYGNPRSYNSALIHAVNSVFNNSVAQYNLEELPSALVLEDLVGTNIGLEGMYTFWSGTLEVTNIHRTADLK